MLLSSADISVWTGSFMWPLIRVGALLSVAPVFGSRLLPRRVRLTLALVLTWVVVPLVPPIPAIEPISPAGLLVTAQQMLIGLIMGFMLRLAFAALEVGGEFLSVQMGLGFASLIDPQNGGPMPVLSHFYDITGTLIFLSLNGHLILIEMLVHSFQTLPIGNENLSPGVFWKLVGWGSQMFAGAVLITLPAIASMLVVNLAFGVMTRASPQLNVFAVGFPITLLLGLVIVLFSLPSLLPQLQQLFDSAFQVISELLADGGT